MQGTELLWGVLASVYSALTQCTAVDSAVFCTKYFVLVLCADKARPRYLFVGR